MEISENINMAQNSETEKFRRQHKFHVEVQWPHG